MRCCCAGICCGARVKTGRDVRENFEENGIGQKRAYAGKHTLSFFYFLFGQISTSTNTGEWSDSGR